MKKVCRSAFVFVRSTLRIRRENRRCHGRTGSGLFSIVSLFFARRLYRDIKKETGRMPAKES